MSSDQRPTEPSLILQDPFDILVAALDMPGVDGKSLCRRIREAALSHYLYILILIARTGDDDVQRVWTQAPMTSSESQPPASNYWRD